jgi:catechol 2,3-dioxygenase
MAAARVQVGQGDHLVSEALYLSDPDGNGIEVYRDRPRDTWRWSGSQIQMDTLPVDLRGLVAAAEREGAAPDHAPAGTVIGHVHLKVSDLGVARDFFEGTLGFDVVAQMPGALFVSAGGYHHHFGLNTWQSRGAGPAPDGAAGLVSYTIALPDSAALERVATRLAARGVAHSREGADVVAQDPWGGRVVLTVDAAQ